MHPILILWLWSFTVISILIYFQPELVLTEGKYTIVIASY